MKFVVEEGGFAPVREHETDAGVDLRTPINVDIEPYSSVKIDLRVRVEIPNGYVGLLTSKSGLMDEDITTRGTIDCGYSGTIGVRIFNHGKYPITFERGRKITQLVVTPCIMDKVEIVDEITAGERGENGFGSTGTGVKKKIHVESGIEYLDLSTKTYHILRRNDIDTVKQLLGWFHAGSQRRRIKGIGEQTLSEIEARLDEYEYDYHA